MVVSIEVLAELLQVFGTLNLNLQSLSISFSDDHEPIFFLKHRNIISNRLRLINSVLSQWYFHKVSKQRLSVFRLRYPDPLHSLLT
jgi:hypothetical protein